MRKMRALRETREHNERKRPRENLREAVEEKKCGYHGDTRKKNEI